MKKRRYLKKGLAVFLTAAMVVGLVPAMSGEAVEVQAANENSTDTTPSVTAYATKEQLMDTTFAPNSDNSDEDNYGKANNYGKIVFGKNESGNPQEWYILGADSGVTGDNTIIFAASPIAANQNFDDSDNTDERKCYDPEWECEYQDYTMTVNESVFRNHYGGSTLRKTLQDMVEAGNTTYFTETEKELMNSTTVKTTDEKQRPSGSGNRYDYTTTDKLYALAKGNNKRIIKAGTGDRTALNLEYYWEEASGRGKFWVRTGSGSQKLASCTYWTIAGPICTDENVTNTYDVRPASNLNLSSVLFASGATAASSEIVSGTIPSGTAMTLRLNGADTAIGTVIYNTDSTDPTNGKIAACKDEAATGTVSLVVQGKEGDDDWYYSVPVEGTIVVTAEQISRKLDLNNLDLADCKIWLETTIDNVTYAKMAEIKEFSVKYVDSIAVTDMNAPVGGNAFDTEASCNTTGIATTTTTPAITYSTTGENCDVDVTGIADWNTTYKATFKLATYIEDNNEGTAVYVFGDSVSVTVDGETLTDKFTPNPDGTLTVTKEFVTAKRKIISVTTPTVPKTFTTYYGYDGYADVLSNGGNSELGKQVTVTLEGTANVASITEKMNVTWMIANTNDAPYDKTPGATNTFRWTVSDTKVENYDITGCSSNYDNNTETITGTVTITNKAATPVTITGTDGSVAYTGATIDVSQYFTIDSHAGTSTYSLITGADGGTGEGEISGTTLTVTKTGTFKIKVNTAANGIYGAGEETITLAVDNGTTLYTATDYSGTYDGQPHSIGVNVTKPEGTTVTYSTDGTTYGDENPSFINEGTYTVYYRITKDNYNMIDGSKTVTISKKTVTITAKDQTVMWNVDIDRSKNSVSENGLAEGDALSEITLTPSTTALTENGSISVSGVKIENAKGVDVTGNYDITSINGTLKIVHNTTLTPDRIEAVKTRTDYTAGDSLNVDDITVTAHYEDGYSEKVTDYTTNVSTIDMSKAGEKTLTVSYTKNGGTKTRDIIVTVVACTHDGDKEVRNAKVATCTEKGYTGDIYCKHCGALLETGTETDMIPHTYVNGVCSVCDKIFEMTVNGITYKVVTETGENGKPVGKVVTVSGNENPQVAVAVTGTGDDFTEKNPDGKVTIPSEITGSGLEKTFVVTKISDNAFRGASVTEIVVPATVAEVGTEAFGNAPAITFNGSIAPSGIADAIADNTTVHVPEGAKERYQEALGENADIVEAHTHTFAAEWSYDETYHWHASTCGHEEEIADKAEHTFGEWTVTKEATEDAEGLKERSCSCGYKETAKLAHTIHVKDEGIRVEPTCEKKGSITYKCTKCGEVMEVVELDALGHSYTSKVTKAATITSTGVKTYTCTRCGHQYTEVIPKLSIVAPAKGKKLTDTTSKAVFTVTKAGKVTTSAGTGKVTVTAGEVAYTKATNTSATALTIPSTVKIDGITYKITSIGAKAFANNKKLTKVTMGSNVKTIGSKAFYKCTKLKTVKIGKSVTTIGASAFYGCTKLDTVSMGAKVATISDKAFYKCTALKATIIPSTVKKLGKQAFYGCRKLKTVKIKTTKLSSSKVGSKAFTGIYAEATVKVPKSKYKAYKKLLKTKGLGAKASVKK